MPDTTGFEFVKQLGQDLAQGNFDLPPFPETAMKVQEMLRDPEVSVHKLGAIVLSEPLLAARILRLANSAALRGSMEITDINMAISRIGLDMVQNAAIALASREAFKAPAGSACLRELNKVRQHSIRVAALAYVLGRRCKFVGKADDAMLAGLLHGVGKFYILMRAGDFPAVFTDDGALQQLMARWHGGVGRAIVEAWDFPERIANAVDEYEVLEREEFMAADITDLILVANIVVSAKSREDALETLEGLASVSRLKTDAQGIGSILEEQNEEIQSMVQALSG